MEISRLGHPRWIGCKKALSEKNKNNVSSLEYDEYEETATTTQTHSRSKKEELYEIRIKGTVQCNGPKIINKTFVADKVQAQMFQGSRRYEAIEGWIHANYPSAKPQSSYRNFAVEVKLLK